MKSPRKTVEDRTAYAVPTLAQARAIHAFSKNEATPEEQKLFWLWLIQDACGAGKDALVPGYPDVMAYLNGRLSVSLQIGWVLRQKIEAFRKGEVDV